MTKCCGLCQNYVSETLKCDALPVLPDSIYRLEESRKKMRPNDGINCKLFKDGNTRR